MFCEFGGDGMCRVVACGVKFVYIATYGGAFTDSDNKAVCNPGRGEASPDRTYLGLLLAGVPARGLRRLILVLFALLAFTLVLNHVRRRNHPLLSPLLLLLLPLLSLSRMTKVLLRRVYSLLGLSTSLPNASTVTVTRR